MNDIVESLRVLARHLEELEIAYAVIGGMAVSVHSEPRFTADVDLAVSVASDDEAESVIYQLVSRGYQTQSIIEQTRSGRLATARLQLGDFAVTDILFGSSGVEPEIVANAEEIEIVPGLALPVASIGDLIVLKLLSAADDRPQDQIDIRNLRDVAHGQDFERARWIAGCIMERSTNRGRDLVTLVNELEAIH